jgi:hypothetical protein
MCAGISRVTINLVLLSEHKLQRKTVRWKVSCSFGIVFVSLCKHSSICCCLILLDLDTKKMQVSSYLSPPSSPLSARVEKAAEERDRLQGSMEKYRASGSPLWRKDLEQLVADRRALAEPQVLFADQETQSDPPSPLPQPSTPVVEPSILNSPEERVRQARATLQALAADAEGIDRRYPEEPVPADCNWSEEVDARNRLIAMLHDRVRVLEHALHLPPYPYPLYPLTLRPFPPLPLPSDKDTAIRRLLSDNRLLREAVTALQRAIREYELHAARVASGRRAGTPSSPKSPLARVSSPGSPKQGRTPGSPGLGASSVSFAAPAAEAEGDTAPAEAGSPPVVEQMLQLSEHSARLSADNVRLYDELGATEAAYHVRVMDLSTALSSVRGTASPSVLLLRRPDELCAGAVPCAHAGGAKRVSGGARAPSRGVTAVGVVVAVWRERSSFAGIVAVICFVGLQSV